MNIGDYVDDFSLVDQNGETVRFSDMVDRGPVVLYFYIKAKTSG